MVELDYTFPGYVPGIDTLSQGHYVGTERFLKNSFFGVDVSLIPINRVYVRSSFALGISKIRHTWFNDLANIGGLTAGDLSRLNGTTNLYTFTSDVSLHYNCVETNRFELSAFGGAGLNILFGEKSFDTAYYAVYDDRLDPSTAEALEPDYRKVRANELLPGLCIGLKARYNVLERFTLGIETLISYDLIYVTRTGPHYARKKYKLELSFPFSIGYRF